MMRPNWGYIGRAPSGRSALRELRLCIFLGSWWHAVTKAPLAAHRLKLPTCFPGYRFEFFDSSHVIPRMADKLLFRVLGGRFPSADYEIVSKVPAHDLVLQFKRRSTTSSLRRRLGA
jgi:hypothetical protein